MSHVTRGLTRGALAGAAGTTALNAVTYLDMALRGRGSSNTPEETVTTVARKLRVTIPGGEESRKNRVDGMGPLLGLATGVVSGAALGAVTARTRPSLGFDAGLATLLAMAGGNVPMATLGVSDPRTWSLADWLSDVLPHAAYGIVTATAMRFMD